MNLFLDLRKAVAIPNTGTDAVPGPRAAREYKESFNKDHSGVTGGDVSEDKPEVGKRWKADEHADDDLEEDRKRDTEIAQERGVVGKPVEETKKALNILKSFTEDLKDQLNKSQPNEREIEYLTTECGYEYADVIKGRARITGRDRDLFNTWLHTRLRKSLQRLANR